jgi:ATP-dependent Clp protease ATP-binding subunit ClpA
MVLSAGAPGEREREQTVGRSDEIAEVLGGVLQWRPRLPVVVAESGAGKTHLLRALGREVARRRPGTRLVKVDLGELFTGTVFDAEREKLLAAVLDEAAFELDILALERLDLALAEAPHGPLRLARAIDGGSRVIGTTLPEALSRFDGTPLTRHLHTVGLEPLTARETLEAVRGVIGAIAAHHQVRIDESLAQAVVERAATLAGCFPAKAIALIDAAGARAHLVGAPSVDLSHVYVAACGFKEVEE